jgi:hypothetical protein
VLSIDDIRRSLERPDLTDEQAAEVRDLLYTLARLLIADYLAEGGKPVPKQT